MYSYFLVLQARNNDADNNDILYIQSLNNTKLTQSLQNHTLHGSLGTLLCRCRVSKDEADDSLAISLEMYTSISALYFLKYTITKN